MVLLSGMTPGGAQGIQPESAAGQGKPPAHCTMTWVLNSSILIQKTLSLATGSLHVDIVIYRSVRELMVEVQSNSD